MISCPVCDLRFVKNSHNQIFCQSMCMDLARHRRKKNLPINNNEYYLFKSKPKACLVCKNTFKPYLTSKQVYCSRKCNIISKLRRDRGVPLDQENPSEKVCLVCDSKFSLSTLAQKYCSKKCAGLAYQRRIRSIPENIGSASCLVCAKEFKKKRANNHSYCSTKCKKLANSRRFYGKEIFGPPKFNRGEGTITSHGYRVLTRRGHPNSSKRGQILEHIYVMSESLGRPLHQHESVHHKNGIRDDNRIENLELWCKTEKHHHRWGQRVEDKIKWCKEFLSLYDEEYRNFLLTKGLEAENKT